MSSTGQYGQFLVSEAKAAVTASIGTPGGMDPERIRAAIIQKLQGQPVDQSTADKIIPNLMAAERRGGALVTELQTASPDRRAQVLRVIDCTSPSFDSDTAQAVYMMVLNNAWPYPIPRAQAP